MIEEMHEKYRRFFYCHADRITEYDAAGYIVSDGVRWNEEREWCYWGGLLVLLAGFCIVFVILAFTPPIRDRVLIATILGLFFFGTGGMMFAYRFRERALIFTNDGRILTPHGFPGYPFRKKIDGVHSNIDSIGIRLTELPQGQHGKPHGVMIYSRGGDILSVSSEDLHHDYAYKIAVQLNHALASFR
jgi:hypothetical protein